MIENMIEIPRYTHNCELENWQKKSDGRMVCHEGYTLYVEEETDDCVHYRCEGGHHRYIMKKKPDIKQTISVKVNLDGGLDYDCKN